MKFEPADWKQVHKVTYTNQSTDLFFNGYKTQAKDKEDNTPKTQAEQATPYRIHPYRSFSTLLPRFWIPYPAADESGLAIAAITAGRDVLGKHTYVASAQYGLSSRKPSYHFQYVNDQFYPSLAMAFWNAPEIIQFQNGSSDEFFTWYRSRGASAQIYLPHITAGYQQGLSLGIEAEKSAFQNWPLDVKFPPLLPPVYGGKEGGDKW